MHGQQSIKNLEVHVKTNKTWRYEPKEIKYGKVVLLHANKWYVRMEA